MVDVAFYPDAFRLMELLYCKSVQATDKDWVQLQGKFLINGNPSSVVIYLEGPPPGTDILLNSMVVRHAPKTPPTPPPVIEVSDTIPGTSVCKAASFCFIYFRHVGMLRKHNW